jgi:hypothetical protein
VRALEQIDKKFPGHAFTYSLGHEPLDWYFELGDLMLDRIVVRDISRQRKVSMCAPRSIPSS